ncbi:GerAB/ArcD/ProY family transporter [Clostridium psychrophilum]|uniref:GerAB/ArcD/ProY family transporter n=1 Tax=Clostridium psychrophilum TaxID=132926 RepID=UPI001C0BDB21|nr:endospore germination permease [Clostridium psychrophilum]MBU3182638.1 spore germination protein [Clostridium psychrophilum]
MDNRENNITSGQLMGLIVLIQIGAGVLSLPATLAIVCGHDGWISILLYGIIISVIISLIIKLMNRYHNKSIYDINKFLYGNYLGALLNLFIVLYLWYSTCLSLRAYTNVIHVNLLRSTPTFALSILTLIPTCYLAWYGLKYVGRFASTIYLSLSFCCILFFLVFKDLRFNFLLPIGQSGIEGIKASFTPSIYAFLGYEVISVIYPEITNKKKAMKYSIGSNIITTAFYILLILVITSFFGEEMLKKSVHPTITLSRAYKAPIIERMDILFIAIWLPAMAMTTRGYFCVAYYSINKLLSLKKKGIYLLVFTTVTILLSNVPKSISQLKTYDKIMSTAGIFFSFFLVICYLFSFIRKKGVNPHV